MARGRRRSGSRWTLLGLSVIAAATLALVLAAFAHQSEMATPETGNPDSGPTVTASPDVAPLTAVALGDSITLANADPAANVLGDGWFSVLVRGDQRLQYGWNAGVAGNTTAQMATRVDQDVLSHDPDVVFVMGGANDARQKVPADQTRANLAKILDALRDSGTQAVLVTTPPSDEPGVPQRIDAINDAVRALAAERGVPLLDLHDVLADPDGTYKDGASEDGVHPTRAAGDELGRAAVEQFAAITLPSR